MRKLLASILILSMTGCTMYKPQLADIPLIDHKGDLRASASFYMLSEPGLAATASFGMTNHLAAQFHVDADSREVFYHHAAIGLYFPFEKSVFESYLGFGHGHGSVYIDADPATAEGPYSCQFLQLNYGWRQIANTSIDLGFSLKGGVLRPLFDIREPGYDYHGNYTTVYDCHDDPNLLIEPQMFLRVGKGKVQYKLQIGYTHLNHLCEMHTATYLRFSLSNGIVISF